MRLLLDSHCLIWYVDQDHLLGHWSSGVCWLGALIVR